MVGVKYTDKYPPVVEGRLWLWRRGCFVPRKDREQKLRKW